MTGEGIQKIVREREPQLREAVLPIVESYAKEMVKELSGTDHAIKVAIGDYNGWVTQPFLSLDSTADGINRVGYTTSKLQGLGDDAIKLYTKAATDLIVFALGVTTDSIAEWKKSAYSDEIKDAGSMFLAALEAGSEDEKAKSLQALLFAIFSQKRTGCADKYTFLAFSFVVLYSFRREGHLDHCNKFTQSFSKLIWFARAAIFKVITGEAKAKDVGFFE